MKKIIKVKTLWICCFLIFLTILLILTSCSQAKKQNNFPEKSRTLVKENTNLDQREQTKKLTIKQVKLQIETSEYLDNLHLKNDVNCQDCHGKVNENQPLIIPGNKVCIKCHGNYEKLARELQKKEKWKTYNPHYSPHGEDSCVTCHKSHQSFELTCSICHPVRAPERYQ